MSVSKENQTGIGIGSPLIGDLSTHVLDYGHTETYQAERLATAYGDDLRYDHQRGSWFFYREHLWQQDRDGEVEWLVIECARRLQQEARKIVDSPTRNKALTFSILSVTAGHSARSRHRTKPFAVCDYE